MNTARSVRRRCSILVGAIVLALLPAAGVIAAPTEPATYRVTLSGMTPPRFTVSASLPIDGTELIMDTTRPGGIPELDAQGWPAVISNLKVTDTAGQPIGVEPPREAGWKLEQAHSGRLTIDYQVDYSPLAAHGWPAPRESGLADSSHLVLAGR